jgi:membrane protein
MGPLWPGDDGTGRATGGLTAMKERLRRLLARVDCYQQRHTWLGFPVGVTKKFGDDQAGALAALVAYYAFFSIFPLLLLLATVLQYSVGGNPELQQRLQRSVLSQFPAVGTDLGSHVHALHGSVLALVVGAAGALWAGLAVARAGQTALNAVWDVPAAKRPNILVQILRSLLLIVVVGGGVLLTSVISGLSSGAGSYGVALGTGVRVVAVLASLAVNTMLFALAFRVLTVRDVSTRDVLPGAVLAGVFWQALQLAGGYYISHKLKGASQTYGTFGFVIGALSLFHLQAQLTLLAAEVNVVLKARLWPRGLLHQPQTPADERAFAASDHPELYQPIGHQPAAAQPPDEAGTPSPTHSAPQPAARSAAESPTSSRRL